MASLQYTYAVSSSLLNSSTKPEHDTIAPYFETVVVSQTELQAFVNLYTNHNPIIVDAGSTSDVYKAIRDQFANLALMNPGLGVIVDVWVDPSTVTILNPPWKTTTSNVLGIHPTTNKYGITDPVKIAVANVGSGTKPWAMANVQGSKN
jgi:hypothetical protein